MTDDRRQRPRDIPIECKLRLCRPDGLTCKTCGRAVYLAEFIQMEKGGL